MSNKLQKTSSGLILALAMLTSITPLAIDVYLPSFTDMSRYFYTSIDKIEITLSIYLLGFGLGQLLGGPLSDRYGRKVFIFSGLIVYTVFSFLISSSTSVEQLWVYRFLQALGGGFAVVNTSAVVRDIYDGKEAAKVFSVISMIMLIAPMLAPVVGTTILYFSSWQYIFVFLSVYSVLVLFLISRLPETSPKIKEGNLFSNYKKVLLNKNAVFLIIAGSLGTSGFFIFITKASFIYMEYFEMPPVYFAGIFSLNAIGIMVVTKVNVTLLERFSIFRLLKTGILFQAVIASIIYLIGDYLNLYGVIVSLVLYISMLGLVFGNVMSLLLQNFKTLSASATALNGVAGFIVAALIGFLASYFHNGTLERVFMMMMFVSLGSLFIFTFFVKKN